MKAEKSGALLLIVAICIVTVIIMYSNQNQTIDGVERITEANKKDASSFEVIGDISIKVPVMAYSYELNGDYNYDRLTSEGFFYLDGEEVDEKGTLTSGHIYVDMQNSILNNTDKTIELDLEEFYLITIDENWEVARGSMKPRHANVASFSEGVTVDNFKLTLPPYAKTTLIIRYVEETFNVNSGVGGFCYYRVKCNDEIGYYSISVTLFSNKA